jgi:hypothetical protein
MASLLKYNFLASTYIKFDIFIFKVLENSDISTEIYFLIRFLVDSFRQSSGNLIDRPSYSGKDCLDITKIYNFLALV